jgi:magnesium chelatase subunit H
VIVTLDSHAAGPAARATEDLAGDFPGLTVTVHAAAEWGENPQALETARDAVRHGDIVIANLLFLEEHVQAILPDLQARRDACDAMVGVIADPRDRASDADGRARHVETRLGRHEAAEEAARFEHQAVELGRGAMKLLRRLPQILRFMPGKAQDLRAWFLTMQYWLGGSDDNVEAMVRFLVGRYAPDPRMAQGRGAGADRLPRCGALSPRSAGPQDRHRGQADLPGRRNRSPRSAS